MLVECWRQNEQGIDIVYLWNICVDSVVNNNIGVWGDKWRTCASCLEESEQQEVEEAEDKETLVDTQQETEPEPKEEEVPPLISTDQTQDLLVSDFKINYCVISLNLGTVVFGLNWIF